MNFDKEIKVGNKLIGNNHPCFIIAEIGSNHNQDIELAKNLIDKAVEAKADAVKFQSIKFAELYIDSEQDDDFKKFFAQIELNETWYKPLKKYCDERGIIFFSCPTYLKAIELLEEIQVPLYKIASPQTRAFLPLIECVAETHKPAIVSTGYCILPDIQKAVNIFIEKKNPKLILLHCISQYPTEFPNVKLRFMDRIKKEFNCIVGFSDHTLEDHISIAAIAIGAKVIEKHLTLDRSMPGPDHRFALEPQEFKNMVRRIRNVEETLASGDKIQLLKEEKTAVETIRMKLYARIPIKKNDILVRDCIEFRRGKFGIPIEDLSKVLGKKFTHNLGVHGPIEYSILE